MKVSCILLTITAAVHAELVSSGLRLGTGSSVAAYSTARWLNSTVQSIPASTCAPTTITETTTSTIYVTGPPLSQLCQASTVTVFDSRALQPPAEVGAAVSTPGTIYFQVGQDNSTTFLNGSPPTDAILTVASEPTTIIVIPSPSPVEDITSTSTLTSIIQLTITRTVNRANLTSTAIPQSTQQPIHTSSSVVGGVSTTIFASTPIPASYQDDPRSGMAKSSTISSLSTSSDNNSTVFLTLRTSMVRFLTLARPWNSTSMTVPTAGIAYGNFSANVTNASSRGATKTMTMTKTIIVTSNRNHMPSASEVDGAHTTTSLPSTLTLTTVADANPTRSNFEGLHGYTIPINWNQTFSPYPIPASGSISPMSSFSSSIDNRIPSGPRALLSTIDATSIVVSSQTISAAVTQASSKSTSSLPAGSTPTLLNRTLSSSAWSPFVVPPSVASGQSVSAATWSSLSDLINITKSSKSEPSLPSVKDILSFAGPTLSSSKVTGQGSATIMPTPNKLQSSSASPLVSSSSTTGEEDFDLPPVKPTFITNSAGIGDASQTQRIITASPGIPSFRLFGVSAKTGQPSKYTRGV